MGWRLVLAMALTALLCGRMAAAADFFEVTTPNDPRVAGAAVIDTRPLSLCGRASLAGARCLPPGEFLGPHGRLASFRDIPWVLGAAGLSGMATVLVAGDDPERTDFVAGLLYLAGQRRVAILTGPLSPQVAAARDAAPGAPKGMVRNPVYHAWPRADLLVLRTELAAAIVGPHPPLILDGRSLDAYWGRRIDGWRGGHIPGAQALPMAALRLAVAKGRAEARRAADIVAYAADPYRSIAYFALLRAGGDMSARVYAEGWRDWAAHTALPVDSETYPDRLNPITKPAAAAPGLGDGGAAVLAGAGLVLAAVAYYLGRSRA
jgi:thiosulfate/3-mercaptopyruvate sulfurtransferase